MPYCCLFNRLPMVLLSQIIMNLTFLYSGGVRRKQHLSGTKLLKQKFENFEKVLQSYLFNQSFYDEGEKLLRRAYGIFDGWVCVWSQQINNHPTKKPSKHPTKKPQKISRALHRPVAMRNLFSYFFFFFTTGHKHIRRNELADVRRSKKSKRQ